ncbi:MAG: Ig-like domain-containing protein, partial [Bacteroidales bacterium]|nr:Ig-like domain-containing protein [Bacteroidales bacterium]
VKATVLPEDATDKRLKWDSADQVVAGVESSGRVTGRSVGKTTLIVVASNGIVKYCPVVVKKSSSTSSFFATNNSVQPWSSDVDGTYGTGFSATTTNGLFIGYYQHTATLSPPVPNSSHIRIYKNSVLCIKTVSGKKIKKIVIACVPDAYYCNDMTGLEGNPGATADKSALTITWTGSSSKVVLMANNGQVRMEKLSVETE